MYDIAFEKAKGRGGTETEVLKQKQLSEGFIEKEVFWEIWQNSQENICARITLLIKLNSVDLQRHWKRNLSAGVFLWILQNF